MTEERKVIPTQTNIVMYVYTCIYKTREIKKSRLKGQDTWMPSLENWGGICVAVYVYNTCIV